MKRRKASSVDIRNASDIGTPETRAQGQADVFYAYSPDNSSAFKMARITNQFAIDRLRILDSISGRQFNAGNRLKEDLHVGGLSPRVTVNLVAALGPSGGRSEMSDLCVAARQRVRHAMDTLSDTQRAVVLWVCFWDLMATQVGMRLGERSERNARRVGGDVIRESLEALANHYGLPEEER